MSTGTGTLKIYLLGDPGLPESDAYFDFPFPDENGKTKIKTGKVIGGGAMEAANAAGQIAATVYPVVEVAGEGLYALLPGGAVRKSSPPAA